MKCKIERRKRIPLVGKSSCSCYLGCWRGSEESDSFSSSYFELVVLTKPVTLELLIVLRFASAPVGCSHFFESYSTLRHWNTLMVSICIGMHDRSNE